MSLPLQPAHGYVIVVAAAISMHCYVQGFYVGGLRKKYSLEYPDSGSGRLSTKLSDAQWHTFNCAQRAHQNYLESLPFVLITLVLASIQFPLFAASAGVGVLVGRQFYCSGYRANGPQGRSLGAGINGLSQMSLFIATIVCGLQVAQVL